MRFLRSRLSSDGSSSNNAASSSSNGTSLSNSPKIPNKKQLQPPQAPSPLKLLRSIFFRKPTPKRPDAVLAVKTSQPTHLGRLSPDLILEIARFMEPAETCAFILTCRFIYATVGNSCFVNIKESPKALYELLKLLERDLPDYVACPNKGGKLRPIKKSCKSIGWHHESEDQDEDLTFVWFKMLMKRYRQQDLEACESLLSYFAFPPPTAITSKCVFQASGSHRFVDGHLLWRFNAICVAPIYQDFSHVQTLICLCPHLRFEPASFDDEWRLYNRRSGTHDSSIRPRQSGIRPYDAGSCRKCSYCYSEFQIQVKDMGKKGYAMFVTVWMDLGQGTDGFYERRIDLDRYDAVDFTAGSICKAFEGKEPVDFDVERCWPAKDRKLVNKYYKSLPKDNEARDALALYAEQLYQDWLRDVQQNVPNYGWWARDERRLTFLNFK